MDQARGTVRAATGTDTTAAAEISHTDFPFPGRLFQSPWPVTRPDARVLDEQIEQYGKFRDWQVHAANDMSTDLRYLGRDPTPDDWEKSYWRLVEQRSTQPSLHPNPQLTTPITDTARRADCFGKLGKEQERQPTPFGIAYAEAGQRGFARMKAAGVDQMDNVVRLTDGTEVKGNWMMRGDPAQRVIFDLTKGDETDPLHKRTDVVVTVTGDVADQTRILEDAFWQLADPGEFTVQTWADVAYKLFQSPQTVEGSDAVIRTFLAGAGDYRLGRVPVFPHDIDLRALTMTQTDFVRYIVDHDAVMRGVSDKTEVWG
ncbi:hypothetical protein ACFZC5_34390 [Nocardia gamkensis]|uniref:hypothetical protein n=1 Tax=Nocardia gamkensis TaxID=352869 RepID=UPI0036EAF3C2